MVPQALALQGRRAFVALRWGDGRTGRVAGLDLVTGRMLPGKLATSSPGPLVVRLWASLLPVVCASMNFFSALSRQRPMTLQGPSQSVPNHYILTPSTDIAAHDSAPGVQQSTRKDSAPRPARPVRGTAQLLSGALFGGTQLMRHGCRLAQKTVGFR